MTQESCKHHSDSVNCRNLCRTAAPGTSTENCCLHSRAEKEYDTDQHKLCEQARNVSQKASRSN
jgi:hypothetical protein